MGAVLAVPGCEEREWFALPYKGGKKMKRGGLVCFAAAGALCCSTAAPAASLINYAHLDKGASVEVSSCVDWFDSSVSQYNLADPRDLIGGRDYTGPDGNPGYSRYATYGGNTEGPNFLFGNPGGDQWAIVDLGAVRMLQQVGAQYSAVGGGENVALENRSVFDYLGISVSSNGTDWQLVGHLGDKDGDNEPGLFNLGPEGWATTTYFGLENPTSVRYVKYEFGKADAGARVFNLYAEGGDPVPEPATMVLVGSGACGLIAWVRRRKR